MFKLPDEFRLARTTMSSLAEIGLALALLGSKIATATIQTNGIAIKMKKIGNLFCPVEKNRIDIE